MAANGLASSMACAECLRVKAVKDRDVVVAAGMVEGARSGVNVCVVGAM